MRYLAGYSDAVQAQVQAIHARRGLGPLLLSRYPAPHGMRTDRALHTFVTDLKAEHLRRAPPVDKVLYDSKLQGVQHALGLHTAISRKQGARLKSSREIRIASVFKDVPLDFLQMIVVHELAHLKERDHDRAFYQLCESMEPRYHQLELDLRLYLTHLEATGERLWSGSGGNSGGGAPAGIDAQPATGGGP